MDIVSGSESHLGLFVQQILLNGPGTIIQTFARKISMNLKLAQTSIWVNILLVGTGVIGILLLKPNKKVNKFDINVQIKIEDIINSMKNSKMKSSINTPRILSM